MGTDVLKFFFGAIVAVAIPTTNSSQYVWFKETDFSCQSGYLRTNLPIGEDGNAFDIGVSVPYCKKKCEKDIRCQGFGYQDGQQPVCRYKKHIDSNTLTPAPGTSCYTYERHANDARRSRLLRDTCEDTIDCFAGSCDKLIKDTPGLKCEALETMGCNCKGCQCGEGAPETTTTAPPVVVHHSFPHPWVNHPGQVSQGRLGIYPDGSNLAIGQDGTAHEEGVSVDYCKTKCARDKNCKGFNFNPELNYGTCHYKTDISLVPVLDGETVSFWAYERDRQTGSVVVVSGR